MGDTQNGSTHSSVGQQMTLGECIALVRLAGTTGVAPGIVVDVDDLVYLLARTDYCEVCGFTRVTHNSSQRTLTCGKFVNTWR